MIYDREALAWAAGFFDGEGYIGVIDRRGPTGRPAPRLEIAVVQHHDAETIHRFHAAVGGLGRVHDRVRPERGAREWKWIASRHEHVQQVTALLWPWLSSPKREQARNAILGYLGQREVLGVRQWRRLHEAGA